MDREIYVYKIVQVACWVLPVGCLVVVLYVVFGCFVALFCIAVRVVRKAVFVFGML